MLKFQPFLVAAIIAVIIPFLPISSSSAATVMELGKVQCILIVNFSDSFHDAHRFCWEKREMENKDKNKKEPDHKNFPWSATIEEFEWDDKCETECIYKAAGILFDGEALPDKKITTTIFSKGKIAGGYYKAITSSWDDCLDISAEIGKKKSWDCCKMVTHHQHCFSKKMQDSTSKLQVEC